MLYWILWIVGVICTIVSVILFRINIKRDNELLDTIGVIFAEVGVALGFGIPAGAFIGSLIGLKEIGFAVGFAVIIFVIELLLYLLLYGLICLQNFDNIFSRISIIVLIIATIGFGIPKYMDGKQLLEYNKNIEVMAPSSGPAWSHEYELLSFNNVPVQKISGELSGEMSSNIFYGEGEISGSITTTDEIAYWYINKDGKGQYHTISPSVCYIIPVEDNVTPYVKVVTYRETQKTIDHNIEEESVEVLSEWKVYEFYIPKSLIK